MKPWRVLASTVTFKDRWITLRSDHCVTESGKELHPYHVVEFPGWINWVALTPEHDIVLVNEYRHGIGKITLGLPSGAMEATDTTPQSAAERELIEETGYSAATIVQVGALFAVPSRLNNVVYSFLGYGARQVQSQQLDATEDIDIIRMNFVEFFRGVRAQRLQLCGASQVAAVFLAASHLLAQCPPGLEILREALARELIPRG